MTSQEAREALTAALARRAELVQVAVALTGRKATAAWRAVEDADTVARFAAQDVEMATRCGMVGATEVEIMAAALS